MDIQNWIQGIAAEANRATPERFGLAAFLQPRQDVADQVDRPQKRKRPRLSGSSFLEPLDPPRSTNLKRSGSNGSRTASRSPAASPSPGQSSALGGESSDRYRRKPRRKPLGANRNTAEKSKRDKSHQKSQKPKKGMENNKKRTRRQHKSDASRIPDVQANRVYTNRLTLAHTSGPGIFGNAKTSAARRGPELPDLAFSRINYSKLADEVDEARQKQDMRRPKDKDKLRRQEQEISTYFVPPQAPVVVQNLQVVRSRSAPPVASVVARSSTSPDDHFEPRRSDIATTEQAFNLKNQAQTDDGMAKSFSRCSNRANTKGASDKFLNFPKTAGAVRVGEFKFRPGPYRSSSLVAFNESMDSVRQTSQSNRVPRRRQSGEVNYCLNLSGELCSRTSRDVSLSGLSAQQIDKHTLSFPSRSERSTIFEAQKEARPRSHISQQQEAFRKIPTPSPAAHHESCFSHQPCASTSDLENRNLQNLPEESSSSAGHILERCKKAQTHVENLEESNRGDVASKHEFAMYTDYQWPQAGPEKGVDLDDMAKRCADSYPGGPLTGNGYSSNFGNPSIHTSRDFANALESEVSDTYPMPSDFGTKAVRFAQPLGKTVEQPVSHQESEVNIPCVGGLDPGMIRSKVDERLENDHSCSFWKPNKLY